MAANLSWTDWDFEPTVTLGIVAFIAWYLLAHRRRWLRTDDDVSHWMTSARSRSLFTTLGVVASVIALDSPIDRGGDEYLLSIHMVQHLLLMMVAPPLLLLGIAGARPMDRWHGRAWRLWLTITRPWVACVTFNVVLLVWHVPPLYNTTLTVEPLHIFEHVTFIAAGIVFWWPLVDPVSHSPRRRVSPLEKIAVLGVAGFPPTVLGLMFTVSHHAFYSFYVAAPRLWGLSPLADQQVAGVIMFGLGNLIYAFAIGVIFLRLFSDPAREEAQALADLAGQQGHGIRAGGPIS